MVPIVTLGKPVQAAEQLGPWLYIGGIPGIETAEVELGRVAKKDLLTLSLVSLGDSCCVGPGEGGYLYLPHT